MSAREVTGADGKTITVPESEWYINTKARARRMMLNSLSGEARRIFACLELATMGFSQELAVIMVKGVQRPLRPEHIAEQTGLSNQNVRRGLVELENTGLAERRSDDDGPLRHSHSHIYSWAFPRAAKVSGSSRARLLPEWFPVQWNAFKPLINRFKLSVTVDEVAARDYFEEGSEIARKYAAAEEVAARFLERVCARRPYKEERNGKEPERNLDAILVPEPLPSSSSSPKPATTTTAMPDADFDTAVVDAFKEHGKPNPTANQLQELRRSLPDHPEARPAFLPVLREKVPKLKHPGGLPSVVSEFALGWNAGERPPTLPEPVCWICNRLLDGGAINGAHFECFAAAAKGAGA